MKKTTIPSIALTLCLLTTSFSTIAPKAYMVDDVVSIKTVNTDACVSTTANSKYNVEDIQSALDMDSDVLGSSARVNTTTIDATDLSNWYVYDHYDVEAYGGETTATESQRKANWVAENQYNEALRPYYENSQSWGGDINHFMNYTNSSIPNPRPTEPMTIAQLTAANAGGLSATSPWGFVYNFKEHIAASSEKGKAAMNFYGYPERPYTDFLFYPAASEGTKKVRYTVDATNVKTHSLNSAGFLFNAGVKGSGASQTLDGYLLLFDYVAGTTGGGNAIASGLKNAYIYKLNDVNVQNMHSGAMYLNTNATTFGGTLVASKDLTELSDYPFAGHFDVSDIEMEITKNSVRVVMTEAGKSASALYPQKRTLFQFSNLADTSYGGFGPLVSYQSHSCQYTSSYKYSNLQMSIATTNSVLDGVNHTDFIEKGTDSAGNNLVDTTKFYVLIGDNSQGATGYKDYFNLQDDAIFLEKLKQQNVVLITNLKTEPIAQDINGTNYKLSDYLGEGNVYEITDGSLDDMATEIKAIMQSKSYQADAADAAQDALGDVIAAPGQSAAVCQVTYKGLQVDSIDRNNIPSAGLTLKLEDPCAIGVSTPEYTIKNQNGTVVYNGPSNTVTINASPTWAAGEYTAEIQYPEGISATTTFSILALYDSYLNGASNSDGSDEDGVATRFGEIGPKTVKGGQDFVATFPKNSINEIPTIISISVDANHDGVLDPSEELDPSDYTMDNLPTKGVLTISGEKTVGDVYITAKLPYTIKKVNWHYAQPITWQSLGYDYQDKIVRSTDTELKAKLLWNDCRDYFGAPVIKVEVDGTPIADDAFTYDATTGEFHMPQSAITGAVDVYVDRPFLEADVIVEKTNLGYTGPETIAGTTNYEATLTADPGYALPETITLLHQPGNIVTGPRAFVAYETGDYTYNKNTGVITLPASKIDGELKLIADGVMQTYSVGAQGTACTYQGMTTGDVEHAYQGTFVADTHYTLPETVVVNRDGEVLTSGYSYDPVTGVVDIQKGQIVGDIVIEAVATAVPYTVTVEVSHITYDGVATGDVAHSYAATITADAHYELPETIAVIREDQELTTGYTYQRDTGAIEIALGEVTADIKIVANATPIAYSVTSNVENIVYDGAATGDVAHAYEAKLIANDVYALPETIVVKRNGETITSGYTYSKDTGAIAIEQGVITGPITITSAGVERTYSVTVHTSKCTFDGDTTAYASEDYECYFTPNKGYQLPTGVTVMINDQIVRNGYMYTPATGKLVIASEKVRGDIVITVNATANGNKIIYELKHVDSDGAQTAATHQEYKATLKPSAINYILPERIKVVMGETELEAGKEYVYDSKTGAFAILVDVIESDVKIVAEGVKIVLKEEEKLPQSAPKEEELTIIPPTYENKNDGKIIGVTLDMEYSVDGGKTWIHCDTTTINKLGVGTVMLRLCGDEIHQKGNIANITIESATSEYYIPTISMSKQMGCKQKFQIMLLNTDGAIVKTESTNKKIATVSKKGVITSKKKEGKTKIVITMLKDKHVVQYVANVTVSKKVKKNYSLVKFKTKYKGPSIALYKLIYKGKTWKINMTHTKGATITYHSSDSSVATVNKTGKVKGKKNGSATITITVENKNVADQYSVVVRVSKKGEKVKQPKYLKILK